MLGDVPMFGNYTNGAAWDSKPENYSLCQSSFYE